MAQHREASTLGEAGGTTTTFTVTLTTVTKTSQARTGTSWTTQTWTVTETSQTWRGAATTTATVFWDRLPPSDFPEVMYLTVPESETDVKRMGRMKEEVIRYLPENRRGLRVIPGVVPELWPEGRYDRVFKYGQMLPKKRFPHREDPPRPSKTGGGETSGRTDCTWTCKDEGGLYDHFLDAAPGANTLDTCREHCCHDPECKAIRFSPSAVDGPELQCLLYPRGLVAWSLKRPLYEDYRVHLLDHADDAVLAEETSSSSSPEEDEEDEGEEEEEEVDMPWWDIRNLNMARVTSTGRHPDDHDAWPAHHCGCSLSHFTMWMEALRRGVQNLVVFESDGFPSCVQSWRVGGNASDFADLVTALPSRAPEDWDLIVLDKGEFGAEEGAPPAAVVRPASGGGSRSYNLIPWKGRGVAGAAAYMVSRRFLEWFPRDIQEHGFNMVDAWIGCRCSREPNNPSPINCYSILAEGHHAPH